MDKRYWFGCVALMPAVPLLVVSRVSPVAAQDPPVDKGSAAVLRLSLDEIKQRVAADNKLLHLAALNSHG